MSWWEAIVLGFVQGLTEFIPISSSAHISIVGQLIGDSDPGAAFTAVTQLGTESAVLIYFRKDIVRISKAWLSAVFRRRSFKDHDAFMGWLVIVGSIPIVVIGFLLQSTIESTLRNLWITAAMLAGFALVIGVIDSRASTERDINSLTLKHGVLYGLAQCLALIPGVSRSGGTIAAGLLLGYTREAAARFSFLLAIPAVLGSGLLELTKIGDDAAKPTWGPLALATVISFAVGYVVIAWLLRFITTHNFRPFVIYRIGLSLVVASLLVFGKLQASTPV